MAGAPAVADPQYRKLRARQSGSPPTSTRERDGRRTGRGGPAIPEIAREDALLYLGLHRAGFPEE
jgi:hypothetical protein